MIRIAVLGFGTVGSGVAKVLESDRDEIFARTGQKIEIAKILDIRDFSGSEFSDLFVSDFSEIENDPDIGIVVECMGGIEHAFDYVSRALKSGKNCVTSNKALMAAKGYELYKAAEENGTVLLCEASVGGQIPVIKAIREEYDKNTIHQIMGIVNGTTNYILTRMKKDGSKFKTALKQAQEKGFAEADPTDDIEGYDARNKVCILADLAFGEYILPQDVHAEGITGVTSYDMDLASQLGGAVKLIAKTWKNSSGGVCACVYPELVDKDHYLYSVEDEFNGIFIKGNKDTTLCGRGAGMIPTAKAVVQDICDIAKGLKYYPVLEYISPVDFGEYDVRAYIRTADPISDESIKAFGDGAVRIDERTVLTGVITERQLQNLIDGLKNSSVAIESVLRTEI